MCFLFPQRVDKEMKNAEQTFQTQQQKYKELETKMNKLRNEKVSVLNWYRILQLL